MVKLLIKDSGKGFSDKALLNGKEAFFMDDLSRNSKKHYGLGLSIADAIIRGHGGTMILDNCPITGGGMVTLCIPLYKK